MELNKGQVPSPVQNPFSVEKVCSIHLHFTNTFTAEDGWAMRWWGTINFQNGKTEGSQKTGQYREYNDMLSEVKAILDSLQ